MQLIHQCVWWTEFGRKKVSLFPKMNSGIGHIQQLVNELMQSKRLCGATETYLIRFSAHVCFVTEFVFVTNEWPNLIIQKNAYSRFGIWC